MKELGNGKVLVGDVGTGKSLTAAAYYMEREHPRDVYVITTAKKRDSLDWEGDFSFYGISPDPESSRGGARLIVDSWNNIAKYKDVRDGFFILDEQRIVGTGAWTKSFWKIAKHNRWILLSATPGDVWLDYAPVFVANGWYKNITEFKREHVVYSTWAKFPKVERYLGVGKLVRHRNNVIVKMPMVRHTTRRVNYVDVEYDHDLLERITKDRWNPYTMEPLKDVAELFRVARKVVNGDPSRLEKVRELMEKHPRLIIFYNFDYELEELRTLADQSSPSSSTTSMYVGESDLPRSSSPNSNAEVSQASTSNVKMEPGPQPRRGEATSPSSSTCQDQESRRDHWNTGPRSRKRSSSESSGSSFHQHSGDGSLGYSQPGSPNGQTFQSESGGSESWQKSSTSETTKRRTSAKSSLPASSPGSTVTALLPTDIGTGPVPSRVRQDQGAGASGASTSTGSSEFQLAEWNGHKHEPVPKTDRWVYLVQYVAGAEGWNCTTTDAMVFYSLTYSYKNWHQAFGRIDRLNTPYSYLHYYVLRSRSWIDLAVLKSLMAKKSFNEASSGFKW